MAKKLKKKEKKKKATKTKDPRKIMSKILEKHPYKPEIKEIPSRKEREFYEALDSLFEEQSKMEAEERASDIKDLDERGIGYLDGEKTYSLNKGGSVKGRPAKRSAENS